MSIMNNCEDFNNLLMSYSMNIPNNYLLFRVSKCCGYSQLIAIHKNKAFDSKRPTIVTLLENIYEDFGEYTKKKVCYLPKKNSNEVVLMNTDNEMSHYAEGEGNTIGEARVGSNRIINNEPKFKYLHNEDIFQPLAEFSIENLPKAYTIDECKYAVYQLYLDVDCDNETHNNMVTSSGSIAVNSIYNAAGVQDLDYIV